MRLPTVSSRRCAARLFHVGRLLTHLRPRLQRRLRKLASSIMMNWLRPVSGLVAQPATSATAPAASAAQQVAPADLGASIEFGTSEADDGHRT